MPETIHNIISNRKTVYVRFHEMFLDNATFIKKKKKKVSEKTECRKHVGQIPRDLCHSIPADIHRGFFFLSIRLPNYDINRIPAFHPLRDRSSLCIFGAQCREPQSCIVRIEGQLH